MEQTSTPPPPLALLHARKNGKCSKKGFDSYQDKGRYDYLRLGSVVKGRDRCAHERENGIHMLSL